MHSFMTSTALHYLGDQTSARQHLDSIIDQNFTPERHALFGHRAAASAKLSIILWMQGFPDQAVRKAQSAIDDARSLGNALLLCNILAHATCPLAVYVGDLATAECWVAMLLDRSSKHALTARNAQGRCLQGMLLLAQGDIAGVQQHPLQAAALCVPCKGCCFSRRAISLACSSIPCKQRPCAFRAVSACLQGM